MPLRRGRKRGKTNLGPPPPPPQYSAPKITGKRRQRRATEKGNDIHGLSPLLTPFTLPHGMREREREKSQSPKGKRKSNQLVFFFLQKRRGEEEVARKRANSFSLEGKSRELYLLPFEWQKIQIFFFAFPHPEFSWLSAAAKQKTFFLLSQKQSQPCHLV